MKKCKGSSSALAEGYNPLLIPAVQCSGHGDCVRSTGLECREGDTCTAVCACVEGFGGADCGLTSEQLQAAQEMRASYLSAMVGGGLVLSGHKWLGIVVGGGLANTRWQGVRRTLC